MLKMSNLSICKIPNHLETWFFVRLQGVVLALTLMTFTSLAKAAEPTCLWISSYHQGYEWNDGIEKGIEKGLAGVCRLERFFMDTKRNTDSSFGEAKALEALALIKRIKPQVIILSDNNASRYLAVPYLKNKSIPLVFCGLNWNAEVYEYPWPNATGMVEVAPVLPLLTEIKKVVPKPRHGLYLSSDVITEQIDAKHYQQEFAEGGVDVDIRLVNTLDDWIASYRDGQKYDFLVLGNNAGINDWDVSRAAKVAFEYAQRISVTNYDWMMFYAMVGKSKMPEEQGLWAAQVAAEILKGASPDDFPVVTNRRWNLFVNPVLLERAGIILDSAFVRSAIKVSLPLDRQ